MEFDVKTPSPTSNPHWVCGITLLHSRTYGKEMFKHQKLRQFCIWDLRFAQIPFGLIYIRGWCIPLEQELKQNIKISSDEENLRYDSAFYPSCPLLRCSSHSRGTRAWLVVCPLVVCPMFDFEIWNLKPPLPPSHLFVAWTWAHERELRLEMSVNFPLCGNHVEWRSFSGLCGCVFIFPPPLRHCQSGAALFLCYLCCCLLPSLTLFTHSFPSCFSSTVFSVPLVRICAVLPFLKTII